MLHPRAVVVSALALTSAAVLVAVSCGLVPDRWNAPATPAETALTTTGSGPTILELRTDGLADLRFGLSMQEVLPALIGLVGEPSQEIRSHGDMPLGYGGMDTTARMVRFDGLQVVFHDWTGYFRDDGVMHLVSWSAERRTTPTGTVLETPEGVSVGASISELRTAFGSSLHLPDVGQPGCAGPPWYFAVDPNEPWGLIGGLTRPPSDPDAVVGRLSAGAQREGWTQCWQR